MNPKDLPSRISRRDFFTMLTGAGIALCTGCKSLDSGGSVTRSRVINAGPVTAYAAEGVYAAYLEEGFFIIREKGRLFALSSICTHRNCLLTAEPDHTFFCHCHGSEFDENGKVTEGPATIDLPILATHQNERGELLVEVVA